MTAKQQKLVIISSLILFAAASAFMWAQPDADTAQQQLKSTTAKAVLAVTAIRPELSKVSSSISAQGNLVAWQEASIGTEADGLRLTEVRVNVGDKVNKGQVLAVFASATLQADFNLSSADSAEAAALYREAEADLKRMTELKSSGALSGQQIQRYITAAQSARARLDAAKARVHTQQLRLAQSRVLAPDQGIISARTASWPGIISSDQSRQAGMACRGIF